MEDLGDSVRDRLELGLWTEAIEHSFHGLKQLKFDPSKIPPNDSQLDDWSRLVTSQCYAILHLSHNDFENLKTKISFSQKHPALEVWVLGQLALLVMAPSLRTSAFLLPRAFDISILVGEALLLYMSQQQEKDERLKWMYAAYRNFETDTTVRMRKLAERFPESLTAAVRFTSTLYSLSLCFGHIDVAEKLKAATCIKNRLIETLHLIDEMVWDGPKSLPNLVETWAAGFYDIPQWYAGTLEEEIKPDLVDPLSDIVEEEFFVSEGFGQLNFGLGLGEFQEKNSIPHSPERPDVHNSEVRFLSDVKIQQNDLNFFDFKTHEPIEASVVNSEGKPEPTSVRQRPRPICRRESAKLREEQSWTWTLRDPPEEYFHEDSHSELFSAKGSIKDSDISKLWTTKRDQKRGKVSLHKRVLGTNLQANSAYHACIYAYKISDDSWTYRRLLIEILEELKLSENDKGASRDVIEFYLDFWTGGLFTERKRSYVCKRYRRQRSSFLYLNDVKTHEIARSMVDQFNKAIKKLGLKPRLKMLPVWHVQIYKDVDANTIIDYVNVEPKMSGSYVKFTNNYEYVNSHLHQQILDLMTTFSHFSYERSGRKFMVTDLQGWLPDGPGGDVILTDPAINSHDGSLNLTDMAEYGLSAFWQVQHRQCTDLCNILGLNRKEPVSSYQAS